MRSLLVNSLLGSLTCALLLIDTSLSRGQDNAFRLKKGDRIVFLGDSITQGGVGPKGYVTLIKNTLAERHADLGIEVIGAGISGNKVPDLQRRVEKDVIAKKPTVVVIYIGINDVWHGEKDPARGTTPEAFAAGLKEVIGPPYNKHINHELWPEPNVYPIHTRRPNPPTLENI